MACLFLLPLFHIFSNNLVLATDVRMPPTIIQEPQEKPHDFRLEYDYVLTCVGDGHPKPQYEWLKNDKPLILSERHTFLEEGKGTLKLLRLQTSDEGTYQCRVYNQYGTALTRKIDLRKAVLAQYPTKVIFDAPELPEGTPYTLPCQPTKWHPKPTYSWTLVRTPEDREDTQVNLDRRIQMDEDGNLHFSYLMTGDSRNGMLYKCKLFNNVMDVAIGGSYSRLKVTPVATIASFAPKKMFSPKSPLIGLEGQQIVMKCFFSGRPDPTISWLKVNGSLPIGRYDFSDYNTELTVKNLKPSDAGMYRCSAHNSQSPNVFEVVEVKVEAVPVFRNATEMPRDVNETEGADAVIRCKAYATPKADITWYRNGIQLDLDNLPRKFRISPDGETLTIANLCKNCEDGSSDLTVIQCNASNVHGYAFEDAYINVIERTRFTVRPENASMSLEDETAEFSVDVKTDDLTALKLRWYKFDSRHNRHLLYPDKPFVTISDDNRSIAFYLPFNNSRKRAEYHGLYEAVANNSYSADVAQVYLFVEDLPAPAPPAVSQAGLAELWWIVVLVAGLFLLFIVILLCCVCCYRNRGEVYPVDKKERKNGNDPEKELKDSGFFDYKRPDSLPVKGSRASLDSSICVSEEEASLNEYGDVDAGKFTEEGSFIGDYAASPNHKMNQKNHSQA